MKIAILHDYLNQFGGAERVLKIITEIFPDADIFTLLYNKERTSYLFEGKNIKTSFLNSSFIQKHHRFFIPLMPVACHFLKSTQNYDLIISSTAGYSKGFNILGKYHISYCHSPLRYAWEIDYLKNLYAAPNLFSNLIGYKIAKLLKKWDREQSKKVNIFIANSNFTAQRIKSYYQKNSVVINPPVNTRVFYYQPQKNKEIYYLMVGRLLYYKNFDLGIKAFLHLPYKLKIVGRGPEEKKLKKLAQDAKNIEFISNASDTELRRLYNGAQALIFPQIEDFGLVAAEAQSCGTPVIAYTKGGINDIVIPQKTGLFFFEQTAEAIIKAVKDFEKINWSRQFIAKYAHQKFSQAKFIKEFLKVIKNCGIAL